MVAGTKMIGRSNRKEREPLLEADDVENPSKSGE